MGASGEAVAAGLVDSLARPGGNVTGLSFFAVEVSGKRLELLKEVAPKISSVAFLGNSTIVPEMLDLKHLQSVGPSLGVMVQLVEMRGPEDFESAFAAAVRNRADGLIIPRNTSYIAHRYDLVALAAKHRLPAAYGWKDFVEVGGLLSMGGNLADSLRRAATYVDKILKGAKPADLPVERPTKFELVINLKPAKALGLTIPSQLLMEADHVIQ